MNASAFRDILVGVFFFFKFSKLHEPHEINEQSYDFSFNILKEKKKKIKK